jgi:uncharacterized membrane protein
MSQSAKVKSSQASHYKAFAAHVAQRWLVLVWYAISAGIVLIPFLMLVWLMVFYPGAIVGGR